MDLTAQIIKYYLPSFEVFCEVLWSVFLPSCEVFYDVLWSIFLPSQRLQCRQCHGWLMPETDLGCSLLALFVLIRTLSWQVQGALRADRQRQGWFHIRGGDQERVLADRPPSEYPSSHMEPLRHAAGGRPCWPFSCFTSPRGEVMFLCSRRASWIPSSSP